MIQRERPLDLIIQSEHYVELEATDLEDGALDDCRFCPVALAVRRYFPNADAVIVTGEVVTVYIETYEYTWELSLYMRGWIREWDRGEPPFGLPTVKLGPWARQRPTADSTSIELQEWI